MNFILSILQALFLMAGLISVESGSSSLQHEESGHILGVYLHPDHEQEIDNDLLIYLQNLGMTVIETGGNLSDNSLNAIRNSELFLFVRQHRPFITSHLLIKNDSLYLEQDLSLIHFYREELGSKAAAFGLFSYPDVHSPVTVSLLEEYHNRLLAAIEDTPALYYRTAFKDSEIYPSSYSFRSVRYSGRDKTELPPEFVHFIPADQSLETVSDLKYILSNQLSYDQSLLLIPLDWILETTEKYEALITALQIYSEDQQVILPDPEIQVQPPNLNWIVILLILLAGSYLVHFNKSPMYQRSVFRYFTMHNFFIEDLLENRVRPFIPGLILFTQHAILCGITVYLVYNVWVSGLGEEALLTYFPFFSIFGTGGFSFFWLGFAVAAILQFISVAWLHISNKTTGFKQVLALYSWPLQLNLPIVLVLTTVYLAGGSSIWIALFSIVFILIWFIAFNISAFDITRFLEKFRVLYILATVGLHTVIITGIVLILFIYPPVAEPVRFVLSLP